MISRIGHRIQRTPRVLLQEHEGHDKKSELKKNILHCRYEKLIEHKQNASKSQHTTDTYYLLISFTLLVVINNYC